MGSQVCLFRNNRSLYEKQLLSEFHNVDFVHPRSLFIENSTNLTDSGSQIRARVSVPEHLRKRKQQEHHESIESWVENHERRSTAHLGDASPVIANIQDRVSRVERQVSQLRSLHHLVCTMIWAALEERSSLRGRGVNIGSFINAYDVKKSDFC